MNAAFDRAKEEIDRIRLPAAGAAERLGSALQTRGRGGVSCIGNFVGERRASRCVVERFRLRLKQRDGYCR